VKQGDLCGSGCIHADVTDGPHVCRHRDLCSHLVVSSGRYTHIDGEVHRRVPFECYKIGRIAADENSKFITTDAMNDPHIHNHDWARELGLVSFAGYRLLSAIGRPIGVLALFSKRVISGEEDFLLEGLANTAAQVIQGGMTEEALRESEKKFSKLFLASPVHTSVTVLGDGRFLEVNDAFTKVTGYEREEVIGRTTTEIGLWANPKERAKFVKLAKEKGRFRDQRVEFLKKNGNPLIMLWSAERIEIGGEECFISALDDITDREQAEKDLRESEEKYRTILESIEDGYYEVDLKGNFTFVNDSMCKIRGQTKDELIGIGNREYMNPEIAKRVYKIFNQVYRTGKPVKGMEWESIRKDGSIRPVESSVSLMKDTKGEPIGFRGIVRDVTERKRAEEALEESEERFRAIFEQAAVGVGQIETQTGRILRVNQRYCEIAGYTHKRWPEPPLWKPLTRMMWSSPWITSKG